VRPLRDRPGLERRAEQLDLEREAFLAARADEAETLLAQPVSLDTRCGGARGLIDSDA
jgi:hypothetical protein